MDKKEQNVAALDLLNYALRAGYKIEIYGLYVSVDDETETVVLSPGTDPVTVDSPRRKTAVRP